MAVNPTHSKPSYASWTAPPEQKAPPASPSSRPDSRPPPPSADSFEAWGPPGARPSGYASPPGEVFGSSTLGRAGEFGASLTELAGNVEELSTLGSAGAFEASLAELAGNVEELAFAREAEASADELSEDELSEDESETEELPPDPPMTADGRIVPQKDDKRPEEDTRDAKQIVDESPALAHLGRQKDIKFEQLCERTGVDPNLDIRDAKQDPDAVYRMAQVLAFIDGSPDSEGNDRPGQIDDGNIAGITADGDARHGTEAGLLKDFAEQGYDFLKAQETLPTTKDTHVNKDGSNKDNVQWFAGEAAKKTFFIPMWSNILSGIGSSKGGLGGVLKGAAGGAVHTYVDTFLGVLDAFKKGKVSPFQLGLKVYTSQVLGATETPGAVKDLVKKLI